MPRNGSDIYYILPGTEGFPDTTIESEKYNNYIHDVETDLNRPRPIIAGGTGANNAKDARVALGAEVAAQRVTNYDSQVWENGSFWSDNNATGSPVDGHIFGGTAIAIGSGSDWIVLIARDLSDGLDPGRTYVREKTAGVWGAWSQDNTGVMSATPPVNPPDGLLWWNSTDGQLYVYYNDGNSKQWVIASPSPDPAQFLRKTGDTMIGVLGLAVPPVAALDAANKEYVDDKTQTATDNANSAIAIANTKTAKSGDTMSGTLTLSPAIPSDASLVLNKAASGIANDVIGAKSGSLRWAVLVGDYVVETGGNVGSDFRIQGYADSGAYLNTPLYIARASGSIIISGQAFKPGGGLWTDSSDARIKTVEKDYTAGLNEIVQLRPVVYTYKGNDTSEPPTGGSAPYQNSSHYGAANKKFTGLVAQEVENIFPEMVSKRSAYIDGTAVTDMRDLDTTSLVFALINSVRELKARVEELEEA